MTIDKKQKCGAYFKGKDGLGTCDTGCSWYSENCPNNCDNINEEVKA